MHIYVLNQKYQAMQLKCGTCGYLWYCFNQTSYGRSIQLYIELENIFNMITNLY